MNATELEEFKKEMKTNQTDTYSLSKCGHLYHSDCLNLNTLNDPNFMNSCLECNQEIKKSDHPFAQFINYDFIDPRRKLTWSEIEKSCFN
jgi:hypothetical protein